ncbi:PilT protein domain protein [Desulfofarcimen acetoxidans DSM 771]|uniref:Ribonuclease VapC n=1 Tax=Desulfofarcimen acetoxidans (strain ATCC 49208 / DSM 771 / KCTC 5769 / VKM B-1644 / 5575) TaxID=485916 RepID=C8W0P9_DESAS|nr:type II toxin-antitoxin system VapC family toxin [Desulfofarcimen acetoxidans]ACV63304.1 PilT protein domain protein [Desulfofarcimen acetoxidans DSM 771]
MKVVVDTNIIIDHLRGIPQATKQLQEIENGNFEGLISTVVIMELLAAPKPKISEKRLVAINNLLQIFEHLPVDGQIATVAGNLLSQYRASHGLEPMDALIGATALVNDAVLFTLSKKHFKFIKGLVTIDPYLVEED